MKRDRVRAMLFSYQLERYFGAQRLKFQTALATLSPGHRAELERAHFGGNRAEVDWAIERAAIEALGDVLDLLSPPRPRERQPALQE